MDRRNLIDQSNGTHKNDMLIGRSGDDVLVGGKGNDNLNGVDGNDYLDGGDDNDEMNGGIGSDVLKGGTGSDSYYFTTADFAAGEGDVIDDADGQGTVYFDGETLSDITAVAKDLWRTGDGKELRLTAMPDGSQLSAFLTHRPMVHVKHGTAGIH